MKNILSLILLSYLSLTAAYAGNGVERGSVMIKGAGDIQAEIKDYLAMNLSKCNPSNPGDYFELKKQSLRKEKIDQGITDLFYQFEINHLNKNNEKLNSITVEILDSDFHNWRRYEEKLSFEIINDQNQQCL